MFRRAITVCTAVAAVLMTAGSVVPSNAATKVGVLVNATVSSPAGPARLYGNAALWGNALSGQFWAQTVGSPYYFYGAPRVLTFSSANSAHIEADGVYNNRAARLIMDVTRYPSSITFRVIQNNLVIMTNDSGGASRPALISGSVSIFAP